LPELIPKTSGDRSVTIATVSLDDGCTREAWDAYVDGHPESSLYHGTTWLDVIEEAFGKQTILLQARRPGGEIAGVLPLVMIDNRWLGRRLVSLPYCNYGGAVADTDDMAEQLRTAARDEAAEHRAGLELREIGPSNASWQTRSDKVIMTLELPADAELRGESIGSKRRSQVRRSLKEGARIQHGGADLIADFYTVFSRNMRDLGTPVYPFRFFEIIADRMSGHLHVVVVRVGGEAAAAALLLRRGNRIEIPWASSLREFNPIAVNMLLYWEALVYAIDTGCRVFDFGRSTRDTGPHRFKQQWGAKPVNCRWICWPEAEEGESRLRRWGSAAWRRLPLSIANRIGPMVSPDLPW